MALATACVPATFAPTLFGAQILSVETLLVTNYTRHVDAANLRTQPSIDIKNATFCNVTVTYTHPGQDDNIIAEAWLPTEWNGRFQGVGGSGWSTGRASSGAYNEMASAIGNGYATITSDSGLGDTSDPSPWALISPGNVNLYLMQNFGPVSLGDEAVIAKSLIKSFYGKGPVYSYWNGCSTGGRQGLTLAQRWPDAYDGIVAGAPVIYWTKVGLSNIWPQVYMKWTNQFPYGCELDALTAAAVSECDGLDGAVDGLISDPDLCLATFDPFKFVGKTISNCTQTGGPMTISSAAASVANATWHGVRTTDGKQTWYGLNTGADFNLLVGTNCTTGVCRDNPGPFGYSYFTYFTAKDANFDTSNISHEEFDQMGRAGHQQWQSLMDFDDPDLYTFRKLGKKLITFHGLADNLIPPKGTEQYYTQVANLFPDVSNFHRFFPIPGLGHCNGGSGGQPSGLFEQLVAWVENGTAPDHSLMNYTAPDGSKHPRILCPFPQKAVYDKSCGDVTNTACWSCGTGPGSCSKHNQ